MKEKTSPNTATDEVLCCQYWYEWYWPSLVKDAIEQTDVRYLKCCLCCFHILLEAQCENKFINLILKKFDWQPYRNTVVRCSMTETATSVWCLRIHRVTEWLCLCQIRLCFVFVRQMTRADAPDRTRVSNTNLSETSFWFLCSTNKASTHCQSKVQIYCYVF